MPELGAMFSLLRQYGLANCLWRAWYDRGRRTGSVKARFPAWPWQERPLSQWLSDPAMAQGQAYREYRRDRAPAFFFAPGQMPSAALIATAGARAEADDVLKGRFRYFAIHECQMGFPPDWMLNPITGQRDSAANHWCDRGDFEPQRGDIKWYWEPARFSWAFALVRAYAATGDEKYPEGFWAILESFLACNPPQMGPNWQCGQETALRAMACSMALYAFVASPSTTPARLNALARMLAFSGERIEGNIAYALSQRSNHAATEAVGLLTLGLLFPEFSAAGRWRELGFKHLCAEARAHNWTDGSYVQHSMNYQRMTLHCYVWGIRLAQRQGLEFPADVRRRIAASAAFLYALQDDRDGRVPNYGHNDGARILPLSDCDYLDYRPAVGAAHYLMTGQCLYEPGPWQDDLVWLFGAEALDGPIARPPRTSVGFAVGGYYTLRGRESWGMVRCHTYRNRPGQADLLHFDLWWRGVNVLCDVGTFAYYDPPEHWGRYFISTPAHNTVAVGGADQMKKGSRFRWHTLPRAKVLWHRAQASDAMAYWQGEHHGYRRLPSRAVHRRGMARVGEAIWAIVDEITGVGEENVALWWHLPDGPCTLSDDTARIDTPQGQARVTVLSEAAATRRLWRGHDEAGLRAGWQSLSYGDRRGAYAMSTSVRAPLPVRWVTLVALGLRAETEVDWASGRIDWRLEDGSRGAIRLSSPGAPCMIETLTSGTECWNPAREGSDLPAIVDAVYPSST